MRIPFLSSSEYGYVKKGFGLENRVKISIFFTMDLRFFAYLNISNQSLELFPRFDFQMKLETNKS